MQSISDSLHKGQGVYAMASKDESGASVIVWNYQHTNTGRFRTTIEMSGLARDFGDAKMRQRLYMIDQNTSNYWADPEQADLKQVDDRLVTPGKSYSKSVDLEPNAIYLLLPEPVDKHLR